MKVFRTLDDVERASLPDGLLRAIHGWLRELIECHEAAGYRFDPDADGAVGAAQRLDEVSGGTKEQAEASVEIRDAMGGLAEAAGAIREESRRQAIMAERASEAVSAVSAEAEAFRTAARSIALASERLVDATRRLGELATRCRELTGTLASAERE